MLVSEPTKGRELTHGSQMNWTGAEANVRRLQSRISRAAANGEHAQGKNLQKLMVRSVSAQLLAIRQVTQDNSDKHTPGVDGVVCDTPQKRMAACLCISGVTMRTTSDMDTKQQGLEPCEGRLSCTVLRGLGYGNIPWLPGAFRRG